MLSRIDGVSVHYYPDRPGLNNPEVLAPEYTSTGTVSWYDWAGDLHDGVRNLMSHYIGGSTMPIVAGEWAYQSADVGLQTQADYLQRGMLVNFAGGSPVSIWFMDTDKPSESWTYGLFENINSWGASPYGAPKPAYYAMKTLTTNLQNATYVGYLDESNPHDATHIYHQTIAPGWIRELAVGWNEENQVSVESNRYGTYLLNGTPLYMGQLLPWQGGNGNWSSSTGWGDNPWPNFADYLNYTATFNQSNTVTVDGAYHIGGFQFNVGNVFLQGGTLRFAPGSGNIYTATGYDIIASVIADAQDRGDPKHPEMYTNTPETFVLRKCGAGELDLAGNNTFHGSILVGEGVLQIGHDHALGDIHNPLILAGGSFDFTGRSPKTGPFSITAAGSTLYNSVAHTNSTYQFHGATVNNNFTVDANGHLDLHGQIWCTDLNANTLTKNGVGTLTLSGPDDNVSLKLYAHQGVTRLSKESGPGTHAVAWISGIDPGATVKFTGTGEYQVYGGANSDNIAITITGGTLDFNGRNQSDARIMVQTDGSTIANTAAGSSAIYGGALAKIGLDIGANGNLNINTVGDLTINAPLAGIGNIVKNGSGALTMNGEYGILLGGKMTVNAGNVQYSTLDNCPGTGKIVINSGGALVANNPNLITTAQSWLNSGKINTGSTGALALAANTSGLNLSTGGYSGLYVGAKAGGYYTLSGTFTPSGNVYRLGGGGGSLSVTSKLTNSVFTARQLSVNGSGTVILKQQNSANKNTYSGGTIIDSGRLQFNTSYALPDNGSITINANGTLVASGAKDGPAAWLNSNRINTGSTGTLAINSQGTVGGTINMSTYNNLWLGAAGVCSFNGTLIHGNNNGNRYLVGGGGGTLTVSSAFQDQYVGENCNLITKENVVLTGSNNYYGFTEVYGNLSLSNSGNINTTSGVFLYGGALYQNSSTALTQPVYIATGGTIGGTGRYNTNIDVGNGHISPGASGVGSISQTMTIDGNLTLGESSVLDFDLNSEGVCDSLTIANSWNHDVVLDGILNITTTNSNGIPDGGEYHIIRNIYTSRVTDLGLELGEFPAGHAWSVKLVPFSPNLSDLVITAAPEPGTIVLLATALLSLLAYAWRKRR
jgi:autotransporter-associated beta strand protein